MKNKEEVLIKIIQDIFWMARRYAHGRHTYAPGMVREAYTKLMELGVHIDQDETIEPSSPHSAHGMSFRSDWLDDIN